MDDLKRMISASQVVLDQVCGFCHTQPPPLTPFPDSPALPQGNPHCIQNKRRWRQGHAPLHAQRKDCRRPGISCYHPHSGGATNICLPQRLSASINLQRTILEIFQTTQLSPAALAEAAAASHHHQQPNHSSHSNYARSAQVPHATNGYHYPSPGFAPSPREREMRDVRDSARDRRSSAGGPHRHHHRASSRSRSPPPRGSIHSSSSSSTHNGYMHADGPRKRRRPSPSPHPHHPHGQYDSSHIASSEQFPPSPYSSSSRSVDSAEYSPRSRASMTIGSLVNGDGPSQERERD